MTMFTLDTVQNAETLIGRIRNCNPTERDYLIREAASRANFFSFNPGPRFADGKIEFEATTPPTYLQKKIFGRYLSEYFAPVAPLPSSQVIMGRGRSGRPRMRGRNIAQNP